MVDSQAPEWDLTEETVTDLKEIFMMFDTDTDGLLTLDQVYQTFNVMGQKREDVEILECVKR